MVKTFTGPRTAVHMGRCAVCNRNVYGYSDEHAPDPRGLISPAHTYHPINPSDYQMTGDPLPMCYECMNSGATYRRGLSIAMQQWKPLE